MEQRQKPLLPSRPSALPVGCRTSAPLRIELRLPLSSRTAAASCVFLYFSFLAAAFFGAPPPYEEYRAPQGAAICPAQRKNFCSRGRAGRFVKAFYGVVKCTDHRACLPASITASFVDVLDQLGQLDPPGARHMSSTSSSLLLPNFSSSQHGGASGQRTRGARTKRRLSHPNYYLRFSPTIGSGSDEKVRRRISLSQK